MLLGARFGMLDSGRKTARDYVQNGLVAMWDGIENAGWGVHDATATVWKDLIGNKVAEPVQSLEWADDSPIFNGTQYFSIASVSDLFSDLSNITAEAVVFQDRTSETNSGVIGFSDGNTRFLWCFFGLNVNRANGSQSWNYRGNNLVRTIYNESPLITYTSTTSYVCRNGLGNGYLNGAKRTYTTDVATGSLNPGTFNYIGFMRGFKALIGRIHSVRIYNRALTDAEIAANYAVDKARFGI